MLIPVFVSIPNSLNSKQSVAHQLVLEELGHHGLEARTLGRTDYPTSFPLREVLTLAKHCSGGLILGFSQFEATAGAWRRGTPSKAKVSKNQLGARSAPLSAVASGPPAWPAVRRA